MPKRDRSEYTQKRYADPVIREKIKAGAKAFAAANPEKRRVYESKYKAANPEVGRACVRRYREKNREKINAQAAEWRRKNPSQVAVQNSRRRARVVAAHGTLTLDEWDAIKERQVGRCFDCGEKKKLTIGHLVPLSRGGSNLALNIIGQCLSCNSKQHDRVHPAAKPSLFDAGAFAQTGV